MISKRGRGRPTKKVVERENIAQVALDIVSSQGYEALTMSRLAEKIGVSPSALYNHVGGKTDLYALVQDLVMSEIDVEPLRRALADEITATEAMSQWARSYRDVLAHHAPILPHIATMPIAQSPATAEQYSMVVAVLLCGGLDQRRAIPFLIALESFIFGSALDVNAPADIFAVPDRADDDPLKRAVASFASATEHVEGVVNPYAEEPFLRGLEALLGVMSAG
ncbi:TetR/AcrR family transcriptional regulator [Corynebacterium cystitidis]|uniref:Transcriptional regulator, TetR family n=1 Tax=Corynebacterium cystitidis DSM 20524 TaxID=1121357 RepID=A0A1H9QP15_9CORY|nr:TetR/AcrR family transcriptional regulator [Corynebacterium cystitidis]WJY81710.1 Tetracycline repressor protein class E [Corynebacterium cystitidis DSM 20524]SER62194.1 transcriptional regulator, TetR family [Corynebacterium cystitidis DSM 20524]SNV84629.1 TetR family transcriptional regulator [Corynebacterium cystitidis]